MATDEDSKTPPRGRRAVVVAEVRGSHEVLDAITRQVRDTGQVSNQTLDRVDLLRREVMGHLEKQDEQIADLGISVANMDGKLSILVDELAVDRRARSDIRVSTVTASIEVEKSVRLATIDEAAARRKYWRDVAIRVLAGLMTGWAAIATALAGHC